MAARGGSSLPQQAHRSWGLRPKPNQRHADFQSASPPDKRPRRGAGAGAPLCRSGSQCKGRQRAPQDGSLRPQDKDARMRIDAALESPLEKRAALPGVGALSIEPTSARAAIDVDGEGRNGPDNVKRFGSKLNLRRALEVCAPVAAAAAERRHCSGFCVHTRPGAEKETGGGDGGEASIFPTFTRFVVGAVNSPKAVTGAELQAAADNAAGRRGDPGFKRPVAS